MRLQLTLDHKSKQVLPINYQYLIASWIYRTLGNADQAYATQLHQHGYDFAGKNYKLFTFSALQPRWFDLNKEDRSISFAQGPTILELSFYMDEAMQHFVVGLFKDQHFSLSSGRFRVDFEVSSIEVLPKPAFQNCMRYRLQSPLCISRKEEGKTHPQYMAPEEPGYSQLLVQNLYRKQQAVASVVAGQSENAFETLENCSFKILSSSKSKLFRIKGIDVRGYLYDFELCAPAELHEVGYFGGFGEKGSGLGMGLVKIKNYI